MGQNAYISGQLEDSAGNPVPNGQVLVTSPNNGSGNAFAYVSGTTTTTFPLISGTLATGTPATSAYGDVVTADASGNFSFAVTDTRTGTQSYSIYPVSNGQVAGSAITTGIPVADEAITFAPSTTLATISVGAIANYIQNNSSTTLTGLSAQADNGAGAALTTATDNGLNPQISDVYAEPQNSAGHHGPLNQSLTYNLSIDNGGLIYSINGEPLSTIGVSPAAAVTVQYTPGSGYYVNNSATAIPSISPTNALSANGTGAGANAEDFEVGVVNSNTGATTLTIQSGSVSSTAAINFVGGTADQVASFVPGNATVAAGQSQAVSFQVQDTNGNPVPNVATTIQTDQSSNDPLWITQVNGVTLQGSLNMGSGTVSYATEPTPIPLGSVPSAANYSVSQAGVASWTNGSNDVTVYSDAQGNVSMTLQAGGLTYPTQYSATTAANPSNTAPAAQKSAIARFYTDTNGDASVVPLFIGMAAPTSAQVGTNYGNYVIQGALGWTGTGIAPVTPPPITYVNTFTPTVTETGMALGMFGAASTTQINTTLPSGDSLYYVFSATKGSAPQTGSTIGSIANHTQYTMGSVIPTGSAAKDASGNLYSADYYVNVYDVNSNGVIEGFGDAAVQTAAAGNVGTVNGLSIAPGSAASTVTFTATPQIAGDTFQYVLEATPAAAGTALNSTAGTSISTITGAQTYTLGANITPAANTGIDVYEVNSSNDIVTASAIGTTTGVNSTPTTSASIAGTVFTVGSTGEIDFANTPAIGDTVTVGGVTFTYVATGANSTTTFTTASNLTDAINASAALQPYVKASVVGAVITLTGQSASAVAAGTNDSAAFTDGTANTPPSGVGAGTAGTQAVATLSKLATATYSGTINVTVTVSGTTLATVPVTVTTGESVANVATAIANALNANSSINGTYKAASTATTVTLTQNTASALAANAITISIIG